MSTELTKSEEGKSLMVAMKQQVAEHYSADLLSFNRMLDKDPPKSWVKKNQGVSYMPIRIKEDLLRSIFGVFQTEIVGVPRILGNSIVVDVHLKVYHPLMQEWITYAGTGAVPIQTEKGAGPLEFDKINPMALHKNVPSALSFAISNAANKIGRLFGAGLNSKADELVGIMDAYGDGRESTEERNSRIEEERVISFFHKCKDEDAIQALLSDPSVLELVNASERIQSELNSHRETFNPVK
jgi:hypothetical protein